MDETTHLRKNSFLLVEIEEENKNNKIWSNNVFWLMVLDAKE